LDHSPLVEEEEEEEEDPGIDNYHVEASALLVAAHLVNYDEEANGASNDVIETRIQQEVESRLVKQNQDVVVAEPVDSMKATNGREAMLRTSTTQLKQSSWIFGLVFMCVLVAAVVTGVIVSANKKQGTCEPGTAERY
jgi:hypothetical protein